MQGIHQRKYGVEAVIPFVVYDPDGVDLNIAWVPAATDCTVNKNGAGAVQCTNTAADVGSSFTITLTASEMQAARLVVVIIDAATKAILDDAIIIETYGNASAEHAFDRDTASTAQTADLGATVAEPSQGAPSDTASIPDMLAHAYKALIEKLNTTTSGDPDVLEVHNAAGTTLWKKVLTDDGTDYSEAKAISGA